MAKLPGGEMTGNRILNINIYFHEVFLEVLSKNVLLLLRALANFKTSSPWGSYLIFRRFSCCAVTRPRKAKTMTHSYVYHLL